MKKLLTTFLVFVVLFGCSNNNGIHPVSKDGVYLRGEACTINMPFERSIKKISDDFAACIALHKHYKEQ